MEYIFILFSFENIRNLIITNILIVQKRAHLFNALVTIEAPLVQGWEMAYFKAL